MIFKKQEAEQLFRELTIEVAKDKPSEKWLNKIIKFSEACNEGNVKTHIAFLGTSLLAKSLNAKVDLYAIKPNQDKKNPNAYSARTLCHTVLVPLSAELGIDLGVTGREPLNNQPYFRMRSLKDKTPIHSNGKAAFAILLDLIKELTEIKSEKKAREALAAYIYVRKTAQKNYNFTSGDLKVTADTLCKQIDLLLSHATEGGKIAQAVVAGLCDVFAGEDRVDTGRINDPSRKYPGDVSIRVSSDSKSIEKSFEVRDKPVNTSDVHIFGKKCADFGVRESAIVMVSKLQKQLDIEKISAWATQLGIGMTLFHGWTGFIEQILFWSESSKPEAATLAAKQIEKRLIQLEASSAAITYWQGLIKNGI